jgi:hypothetical protein
MTSVIPAMCLMVAAAQSAAVPTLVISSERSDYLVGERLDLTVEIRNDTGLSLQTSTAISPRLLAKVWHRAPGGVFKALDLTSNRHAWATGTRVLQPAEILRGQWVVAVKTHATETPEFVLDRVGRHDLRVSFERSIGNDVVTVESNVLSVDVLLPPPAEAEAALAYTPIMAYVTQLGWGEGFVSSSNQSQIEEFLNRFPSSRYAIPLREGLTGWLEYRVRTPSASAEEKARLERLLAKDAVAPSLTISATPTTIWPPNKAMTLVGINATISDNSGAIPSLRLVSITCDDSCASSTDIAEASFGTDDRSFRLRAERKGGSRGRTYTITYEASDGAGNKATATTAVLVPHDQAKK